MIARGRDLCRLHWDHSRQDPEDQDGLKQGHWVVVLGKVDRGQSFNRFNDGKCDPQGRLWAGKSQWVNTNCQCPSNSCVGTMGNETKPGEVKPEQGTMYFCRQHAEDNQKAIIENKFDKIHISNGLEWSVDGNTFYYIDSLAYKVEAFDYEAVGGVISNRRTVFDLKKVGCALF